jgi:hypothetical protein
VKTAWFALLMSTICFEGLGRRYLPAIPSAAFYFLKDLILLYGFVRYRPAPPVWRTGRWLFRGFEVIWLLGFAWTIIEIFNPEHQSYVLAGIGFRAYWLWWLAPPLVAQVLRDEKERRRAIYVLLGTAAVVALFAVIQFLSPADSAVNVYTYIDGEKVDPTVISETSRSRVASTFSFISGFSDFTILIPALILSVGLDAKDRRLRRLALITTGMMAAVLPMAGSRASVLAGALVLLVSVWTAGLFFTRLGRRILMGGIAAAIMGVAAFPDALLGVQQRFANEEETNTRYVLIAAAVLPPLAIWTVDHPVLGIGTGMQQNARYNLRIPAAYEVEQEFARYLIELGTFGFLILWSIKAGLTVALLRAHRTLKAAGRRGAAAAALSYALLTLMGNLTFDHVWQALYFIGCGFILAEVFAVVNTRTTAPMPQRARAVAFATASIRSASAPPLAQAQGRGRRPEPGAAS